MIPRPIPDIIETGTKSSEVGLKPSPPYMPINEANNTITKISSTDAPAIMSWGILLSLP